MCKVYNQDLRPLVRVPSRSAEWERLRQPSTFCFESDVLQLDFCYTPVSSDDVYFAFFYPFTYTDEQRILDRVASKHQFRRATVSSRVPKNRIYFHRELLVRSVEGRRVELLTVTSCEGALSEREPRIEGLFPSRSQRPHRFRGKPGVYISARVHPAETGASYMFHGLLNFLLDPNNKRAQALRSRFVFKLIPMLNPDGVHRGHFRSDSMGVNLNRMYATPSPTKQPSIWAAKQIIKQMAELLEPSPEDAKAGGLAYFADLHSYTARTGCYLLGNNLPAHKEARSLAYAHLVQMCAPQFSATACSFGRGKKNRRNKDTGAGPVSQAVAAAIAAQNAAKKAHVARLPTASAFGGPANGTITDSDNTRLLKEWARLKEGSVGANEGQKDGTARVAIYREFNTFHSYTIECSCNLRPHDCLGGRTKLTEFSQIGGGGRAAVGRGGDGADEEAVGAEDAVDETGGDDDDDDRGSDDTFEEVGEPFMAVVDALRPDTPHELSLPSLHCAWGTCPLDPPSAFASVGRGLIIALQEMIVGPASPRTGSVVSDSPFLSIDALHRWSRRMTGAVMPFEVAQPASARAQAASGLAFGSRSSGSVSSSSAYSASMSFAGAGTGRRGRAARSRARAGGAGSGDAARSRATARDTSPVDMSVMTQASEGASGERIKPSHPVSPVSMSLFAEDGARSKGGASTAERDLDGETSPRVQPGPLHAVRVGLRPPGVFSATRRQQGAHQRSDALGTGAVLSISGSTRIVDDDADVTDSGSASSGGHRAKQAPLESSGSAAVRLRVQHPAVRGSFGATTMSPLASDDLVGGSTAGSSTRSNPSRPVGSSGGGVPASSAYDAAPGAGGTASPARHRHRRPLVLKAEEVVSPGATGAASGRRAQVDGIASAGMRRAISFKGRAKSADRQRSLQDAGRAGSMPAQVPGGSPHKDEKSPPAPSVSAAAGGGPDDDPAAFYRAFFAAHKVRDLDDELFTHAGRAMADARGADARNAGGNGWASAARPSSRDERTRYGGTVTPIAAGTPSTTVPRALSHLGSAGALLAAGGPRQAAAASNGPPLPPYSGNRSLASSDTAEHVTYRPYGARNTVDKATKELSDALKDVVALSEARRAAGEQAARVDPETVDSFARLSGMPKSGDEVAGGGAGAAPSRSSRHRHRRHRGRTKKGRAAKAAAAGSDATETSGGTDDVGAGDSGDDGDAHSNGNSAGGGSRKPKRRLRKGRRRGGRSRNRGPRQTSRAEETSEMAPPMGSDNLKASE